MCPFAYNKHSWFYLLVYLLIMEYNANEQVWESEGTTRPESPLKEETFDSDDIVKVHVDLEEAKKRFHGRILNADHVSMFCFFLVFYILNYFF